MKFSPLRPCPRLCHRLVVGSSAVKHLSKFSAKHRSPYLLQQAGPPVRQSIQKRQFLSSNRASKIKASMSNFAFAFDIDGVLLRSSQNLPGASKALQFLHEHSIPFILLTNGGGKHEMERVTELSKKFDVPLSVENFVQSHTPFQEMVHGSETQVALKDKTILVTGGDQSKIRNIAELYGFKNVVTPADIITAYPKIWPFNQIWNSYYQDTARSLPQPIDPANQSLGPKVDAIFVYNDPRDWALDSQIIMDLLLSRQGILGTYSSKNGDKSLPNNGWQQDGQPALIFSNPDMFWAAAYHMPRFGQGAFRASLEGVWKDVTDGAHLSRTVIGKPYPETYSYAERVLQKHRAEILGMKFNTDKISKLQRVFMVGDNPESDIRGANEFQSPSGTEWNSILVKTGVYEDGTVPRYEPKVIVDNVLEAIKWALAKEGFEHDAADLVS